MSDKPNPPCSNPAPITICFCHGVNEEEIREAIRQGAISIEKIQEKTLASTGCGGCLCELERLLEEMKLQRE